MTDEEKLRDYVKDNTPHSESRSSASHSPQKPTIQKPKTPLQIYGRHVLVKLFILLLITFVITFLSSLIFATQNPNEETEIIWISVVASTIISIGVGSWLLNLSTFLKWLRGEYYPLRGWDEWVAKRTNKFWKGNWYTSITISIELKKGATSLQHDAARLFIKNWPRTWGKPYSQLGWWSGHPRDFVAKGLVVTGDLSESEIGQLTKMMTSKFIPLAKLLSSHLEAVEIQSEADEREYRRKRESRTPYERQG